MPQSVNEIISQGMAHHQAGRLGQAEACYREALAREPARPDAVQLLGVIAHQAGKHDLAIQWIGSAVAACPTIAAYRNNLGTACRGAGQLQRAIECYRKSIELDPTLADAFLNLTILLADQGQVDDAMLVFHEMARHGHDTAEPMSALVAALDREFRFDESIAIERAALTKRPGDMTLLTLLGNSLHAAGQMHEALACYEEVLARAPQNPESHWNRALMLLTLGDYAQGWREYEWRWQCVNFPYKRQQFPQPIWDGSDPAGRTILLDSEGGFGDIIQFVRYARLLADRGVRIILGCPPELKELLRTVDGVHEILTKGDPLPQFDLQFQLLGCPLKFEATLETIPKSVPYIAAAPDRVARFRGQMQTGQGVCHLGLVWCGRSMPYPNRSCPLALCRPLFDVPNVRFHSLQRDDGRAELSTAPKSWDLINHAEEMGDFADTAAIIANLDLVITIDSAVAHLAGAMGKPVWVMLPYSADWRWMIDRDDCPWYPTMRLFRQSAIGDWEGVTRRVAAALAEQV